MSKLFYSDTGRIVHLQNEEVSQSRRARKQFCLPDAINADATLYILAKSRRDCTLPLRVKVNGQEFTIAPRDPFNQYLTWFAIDILKEYLQPGENTVELWSESTAMDSWMLGIEGRKDNPNSSLSFDGGNTWQNERMSIHHNLQGEYVIRLRLNDPALSDPPPPTFCREMTDSPRLSDMLAVIPKSIQQIDDPWQQSLALSAWVSCQWKFFGVRDALPAAEYSPWDALTILSWRKSEMGQYLANPIAFCVHYSIVFVTAAVALGLSARAVCGTSGMLDGKAGHFVGEIWIENWQKWCHVDPTSDFVYIRDGVPLSTAEISEGRGESLRQFVQVGEGLVNHDPVQSRTHTKTFGPGGAFAEWAVWPRNDFLSRPDLTPPAHGASSYSETDWIWTQLDNPHDLGMFPYRISTEDLDPLFEKK